MRKEQKYRIAGIVVIIVLLALILVVCSIVANWQAKKEYGLDHKEVDIRETTVDTVIMTQETSEIETEAPLPAEKQTNVCENWNFINADTKLLNSDLDEQNDCLVERSGMVVIPMVPVEPKGVLALRSLSADVKVLYYDENKKLIRAEMLGATEGMVIDLPEECIYLSISIPESELNQVILIENDFHQAKIVNEHLGPKGYNSVRKAVESIAENGFVLIFPGTYAGNIKCWGKQIELVGTNRKECILESSSSSYYAPPIEMSAGRLENLTIRSKGGYSSESAGAYAIHIEDNFLQDKSLTIQNCELSSNSNSAVGMGMRGGCTVTIIDSELQGREFGLFCHDSAYAKYSGEQRLIIVRCKIKGQYGNYAVRFDSQGIKDARIDLTLIDNEFSNPNVKDSQQLLSVRNNGGAGLDEHWMQLKNYYLNSKSSGNNISKMNY